MVGVGLVWGIRGLSFCLFFLGFYIVLLFENCLGGEIDFVIWIVVGMGLGIVLEKERVSCLLVC